MSQSIIRSIACLPCTWPKLLDWFPALPRSPSIRNLVWSVCGREFGWGFYKRLRAPFPGSVLIFNVSPPCKNPSFCVYTSVVLFASGTSRRVLAKVHTDRHTCSNNKLKDILYFALLVMFVFSRLFWILKHLCRYNTIRYDTSTCIIVLLLPVLFITAGSLTRIYIIFGDRYLGDKQQSLVYFSN